jgi:hypothetical protein
LGYFNPEPKTKKEEFFNMEEEIDRLSKGEVAVLLISLPWRSKFVIL